MMLATDKRQCRLCWAKRASPPEHRAKVSFTRTGHRRFRRPGAMVLPRARALLPPLCSTIDTTSVREFLRNAGARKTSGQFGYDRRVLPGSLVSSKSLLDQSKESARARESLYAQGTLL